MRRLIAYYLCLCFAAAATAETSESRTNKQDYNFPGGVLELIFEKQSDQLPEIKFGLAEPAILEYPHHWRAIIGISLDTLPGDYVAYYKPNYDGATGEYKKVTVRQKVYPFFEQSTLKNAADTRSKPVETLSDLDYQNTQQPSLPLKEPVKGSWSNDFGHKLLDKKRKTLNMPNKLALRVSHENMVIAPQNAIVSKLIDAKNETTTLYLDHGRGLYSVITGIHDVTVELGNGIVTGAVLGKVNSASIESGSSKPVPITWQVVMNGVYVDPLILMQLTP